MRRTLRERFSTTDSGINTVAGGNQSELSKEPKWTKQVAFASGENGKGNHIGQARGT
jgi:hypothetical protein